MSHISKGADESNSCFEKVNNASTTYPMNCGEYIQVYYRFINDNPTKYTGDFVKEIGNCGIIGCQLPSER